MSTDVKVLDVEGLAHGRFRFSGFTPHGPGKREIRMTITAAEILRLADAIRGCPHNFEDPRTGGRPRDVEDAKHSRFSPMWMGHALWHIKNPDRPMPCRSRDEELIDVEHPLAIVEPSNV